MGCGCKQETWQTGDEAAGEKNRPPTYGFSASGRLTCARRRDQAGVEEKLDDGRHRIRPSIQW